MVGKPVVKKVIAIKASKPKKKPPFNPFVPASVDDGLKSLILQFGVTEVKAALKRATSRKGRSPIKEDNPQLSKFYIEDSRKWLAGEEPLKSRSNYSIAKLIANEEPEHKRESIYRRIYRKLKSDRKFYTHYYASVEAEKNHPHALYGKAITAALRDTKFLKKEAERKVWKTILQMSRQQLKQATKDYFKRYGSAPESNFSVEKIRSLNRNQLSLPTKEVMKSGLLGIEGLLGVTK